MNDKFDNTLNEFRKKYEKEHNIFCPNCKERVSEDSMYQYITYHGGEDKERICDECGYIYIITEDVDRTYTTELKL